MRGLLNPIKDKIQKGNERSVRAKKSIIRMFLNKGLSILFSMMYVPLLLDCLDKTRYGIWLAIMSVIHWIAFLDIGIGHGLRNLLSESMAKNDFYTSKKLVSTAYVSVGVIFSAFILLFIFIYPLVDWYKIVNAPLDLKDEIDVVILVVLCLMCVNFMLSILNSVLFAFQKPEKISDMGLITQGLSLFVIYCFYLKGYVDSLLPIGITLSAIPCIVYMVYSVIFFRGKYKHIAPSIKFFDIKYVKNILVLGGGFFFIQISNMLCFQSNDILITNVISPEKVAEYHVIYKYVSLLFFAFTIIITPFWSATTEAYAKKDIAWIKISEKRLIKVWLFFVIMAVLMVLISPIFFNIWLGDRIYIDIILVIMLCVYVLMNMLSNIYLTFINGIGKIRLQLYLCIALPFVYLPCTILLGSEYGLRGFAAVGIGVLIVYVAVFSIQYRKIMAAINTNKKGIWYQ